MFTKIKSKLTTAIYEFKLVMRNVPTSLISFFCLSLIAMNIAASKLIVNLPWLTLDAAYVISWISFLAMDIIVKRFNPRAAIYVTLFGVFINICFMGLITLCAALPAAGDDYSALNFILASNGSFLGSGWHAILASMSAFLIASVVNAFMNFTVRGMFKRASFVSFFTSSSISTFIGQFFDNLLFATFFTIWLPYDFTIWGILGFALAGAVGESLMQIIFAGAGYRICKRWEREKVGQEYLDYINKKEAL